MSMPISHIRILIQNGYTDDEINQIIMEEEEAAVYDDFRDVMPEHQPLLDFWCNEAGEYRLG